MSRLASISGRTPGPINPTIRFPIGSQVTVGQDRDRTSGSAYNRHSGGLVLLKPFLLEAILWDIATTATYTISLVDSLDFTPNTILVLAADIELTGGSVENTIPITPIVLQPGWYFLSLTASPAVAVADRFNAQVKVNDYLTLIDASYDGSYRDAYTIPIKLRGYVYS